MDPFDEILSDPGFTSRTGGRFQPKIKPRPKKQTLAPQLSTVSQDKKGTTSDAKSCHDGRGNTKSIKSSSQLPVIEENKESEDDLLLATVRSDFIGCSHHTSVESAIMVDSTQLDLDSCGGILPSGSTIDGPVGVENPTDDSKNSGILNYSHSSASRAHEATVLGQSGLGSIQPEDGHSNDGKIAGQNTDVFDELEWLDDFHNQPKNEADPSSLKQATISNEDGDLDTQRLEVEECGAGANITRDIISSGTTTPSEQPACKYIPKPKMRVAGDSCTQISQPEISNTLPPSPQVISCDTRCMHEASIGTHSDGVLNDSSINFDDYSPVNQHIEAPVNVESLAYDSYGDILVDDFNSDDQDEMLREEGGKNGEEDPLSQSNMSQQQEMFPPVGEEIDHSKTSRKLRQQVSHQLDDPEDGVDDFPSERFSNYDIHGDGYKKNGRRGTKTKTKSLKPSSDNEKPARKRKEANKAVPDLQAEKRPKKFSHSTRRNRRQVNKVLLETPEDEIDFQKISFRDLIIYHEHKEKLEKKEATTRQPATNQRTDTVGEEIYNDGEESLADEQGRGTDDDETPDVVDMTSAYFNYHSFMDKTSRTKWSKHDTERFYEAVRQFGTDFCMIQQLFPGRTRHQIKLKFKNEERHHPFRLSDAITNRAKDHSQFLSLIGQLQEAANKAKHESNEDELTENSGDEELGELAPETNEEEVAKPGEVEDTKMEEFVGEIHSPLKADGSDDDDPHRWDEYKFDYW
ncbi:uncharacterized protein LOC111444681 isoform X1 [Cucurbita moschata]|uniref:Uncharacterized protein LOC111444681 isoform X1 n=1 Tax=Cucurbita moschata TaxID=3662 RepID=A0A6J1FJU1_CUCMO|nr:uncharacterized protein LOC111444681 isoform X1 [Cucurbita moschata]XP_022938445.1 uncharacterized protein LOC111444681 isoform X1 [Cucurbita moschata]